MCACVYECAHYVCKCVFTAFVLAHQPLPPKYSEKVSRTTDNSIDLAHGFPLCCYGKGTQHRSTNAQEQNPLQSRLRASFLLFTQSLTDVPVEVDTIEKFLRHERKSLVESIPLILVLLIPAGITSERTEKHHQALLIRNHHPYNDLSMVQINLLLRHLRRNEGVNERAIT